MDVLSGTTEHQEVGGLQVEVLSEPARALHVALHAAQHGRDWDVPMEDLRRAVDILPFETLERGSASGRTTRCDGRVRHGPTTLAGGQTRRGSAESVAHAHPSRLCSGAQSPPHLTLGFERLHSLEGPGAKARFVVRKLFPPRGNMRFMTPLAAEVGLDWRPPICVRLGLACPPCGPRLSRVDSGTAGGGDADPVPASPPSAPAGGPCARCGSTRRQLAIGGIDALRVKPPPRLPPEAESGIRRHSGFAGIPAWSSQPCGSNGSPRKDRYRDIVIGVTAPRRRLSGPMPGSRVIRPVTRRDSRSCSAIPRSGEGSLHAG